MVSGSAARAPLTAFGSAATGVSTGLAAGVLVAFASGVAAGVLVAFASGVLRRRGGCSSPSPRACSPASRPACSSPSPRVCSPVSRRGCSSPLPRACSPAWRRESRPAWRQACSPAAPGAAPSASHSRRRRRPSTSCCADPHRPPRPHGLHLAYGLGIRSRAASPSTVYALAVAASAWMTPPVSASSGMRSGLRLLAAVSWARARSSAARPCAVGFVAALSERTPAARAASSLETTGGRPL